MRHAIIAVRIVLALVVVVASTAAHALVDDGRDGSSTKATTVSGTIEALEEDDAGNALSLALWIDDDSVFPLTTNARAKQPFQHIGRVIRITGRAIRVADGDGAAGDEMLEVIEFALVEEPDS